ncbi:MAG: hypothetical protein QOI36_1332, partial [Pseudonocardiales bacterium]|nr:hypothetical protein [Pseudonocardiales bacterium]
SAVEAANEARGSRTDLPLVARPHA